MQLYVNYHLTKICDYIKVVKLLIFLVRDVLCYPFFIGCCTVYEIVFQMVRFLFVICKLLLTDSLVRLFG